MMYKTQKKQPRAVYSNFVSGLMVPSHVLTCCRHLISPLSHGTNYLRSLRVLPRSPSALQKANNDKSNRHTFQNQVTTLRRSILRYMPTQCFRLKCKTLTLCPVVKVLREYCQPTSTLGKSFKTVHQWSFHSRIPVGIIMKPCNQTETFKGSRVLQTRDIAVLIRADTKSS